jgi:threonine/homoserine/homoserine lactone efflux protein
MAITLLAFAGAALLLAMVPGPSTAVVIQQTLRGGRGAAFAATLANEVGLLFWAVTASFGLSVLIAASQVAYDALRVGGAAVLIVLGIQSILHARHIRKESGEMVIPAAEPGASRRHAFRIGLLTILANPKAAIFAASFLPQFVPPHAPVLPVMLLLSAIWVVIDASWYVVLSWSVHQARRFLLRPVVRRRLEQISGLVLIGFGLRVALEHR